MEPCEFLSWDTNFFGFRIARVRGNHLSDEQLPEILDWCIANKVRCLYFLAAVDDPHTVHLAEDAGFRQVDMRITFERNLLDRNIQPVRNEREGIKIRPVEKGDVPLLQRIARDSYTMTRFYFDEGFPRQRAGDLYDVWIKQSCEGYADQVLVAEFHNEPVGYITCHLSEREPEFGSIGLVGISPKTQGSGLGGLLIQRGLDWYADRMVSRVEVVTQGRNIKAQRLYQRCGFLTSNVQLWYHKWFGE